MGDVKDRRPGGGGASADTVLYKDEGDGTWSETVSSYLRGWNATSLAWQKLTVNNSTGRLEVDALISTGDIQIGAVEIKNATTDDRATVSAAGALKVDGSAVNQPVVGNVASGAADSGNPVKVGGVYNSTLPTGTTGQRLDAQLGLRGSLAVQLMTTDGTAGATVASAPGDAVSNTRSALSTEARLSGYNGTTWDRLRSDTTNGLDVDVTRVSGTVTTKEVRSATTAVTQVGDAATNTTLLAANANRQGATIYNDSSAVLRVKLGATASATSFTVVLAGNGSGVGGYFEVPSEYTGIIDGIWASDAGGNAYITELTA